VSTDQPPVALCNYCGLRPAGSHEHLPGVAALNDTPVTVRFLRPSRGGFQHVERVEPEGFVVRTICRQCNQRTGGSYGAAFKEFALQFAASGALAAGHQRAWISLREIQPLRVLKQIAAMVLAAQANLSLTRWSELRQFVLRRDQRLASAERRFYLYRNTSSIGRITSFTGMAFLRVSPPLAPMFFSEISWPPLGIVCSLGRHPLLERMKDITAWGQYAFRSRDSFGFSVPQLSVEANWPLAFGSEAEADRWIERLGVATTVQSATEVDAPTQLSALIRRHRAPSA